jgi:hypothetical protein
MSNGETQTADLFRPAHDTLVRWRPWPRESCRGGSTAIGFLGSGAGSDADKQEGGRNAQIATGEVWIGDARSDNFILAGSEVIPIDIRIWGVPIPAGAR